MFSINGFKGTSVKNIAEAVGIKDYYYTNNYVGTNGLTLKFGGAAFTYTLLDIKDKIGWEAFKTTFRKFLNMSENGFALSKN